MIPGQREQIMAALAALVFSSSGFATTSRRLQWWDKVSDQPAIFTRHVRERVEHQARGQPSVTTMHAEIWIYCRNDEDPTTAPETQINALVDAVESVVAPSNARFGYQSLGGLVQHCWIAGDIEYATGDSGQQAIAYIPIGILVP